MARKCPALVSPMHLIRGKWRVFDQGMNPARITPTALSPQSDSLIEFQPLENLATGGIYSASLMQQVQESLQFPNQRAAVMNVVSRSVVGQAVNLNEFYPENFFSPKSLDNLKNSILNRIKEGLLSFGNWVSIIIGFVAISMIIKTFIDVTFCSRLMYQTFGCG